MLDRRRLERRLNDYPKQMISMGDLRPAAILLPLLVRDGVDQVLLTQRTDHLPHHAGEISFPGGAWQADDADLLVTALRETEEELGIPADRVDVHGRLDDFYSVYGYHVVPYVGTIPSPFDYRLDPGEIAAVIEAPLDHFRDPAVHHQEDWTHKGRHHLVDFYRFEEHVIWGMTAAILKQLVQDVEPTRS